jgi:maleate cis-trans isomerase
MKHINILIPASNIVAERELYQYIINNNLDMALHFARLTFKTAYGENQEQYTKELVESIPVALGQLSRIKAEKTAVLCSSAELYYTGNENLIFPLSSMTQSMQQYNVNSPLIITPYNQNIGEKSVIELMNHKIKPTKSIHLDIKSKEALFNYSINHLVGKIEQEITSNADSICVLCTNFATMHLAKQIEEKFNLPFISSNLAIIERITKVR